MSNGYKVLAPNGLQYAFHGDSLTGARGFVYALGHRVYGRLGELTWNADLGTHVRSFTPSATGRWSFTVAAVESVPVTESASA